MKTLKNINRILILALSIYAFTGCKEAVVVPYSIIPEPQQIVYGNGTFVLPDQLTVAFPQELSGEAMLMEEWLSSDFSIQTVEKASTKADIVLAINPFVMPGRPEGYILDVKRKKVTITADTPAGILHGIQTLRQVVRNEDGRLVVQTGTIEDYPTLGWRAFMLDERYFKGKDVIFRTLDNMSQLKLNIFHWHFTESVCWRLEMKKYPKLTEIGAYRDSTELKTWGSNIYDGTPHGGYYTQDDAKEIVEYAAKRHIMVIPEIDMPGHSGAAIASYPWLGTVGKPFKVPCMFRSPDVYNVTDPNVLEFLEDVIDETIALFPAPIFHIGGDEVNYDFWKNSPKVQAYMKQHGIKTPAELQVHFTNRMSNLLASKNKRMMGWNEIAGTKLQTAEAPAGEQLAPGTIVHFWTGDPRVIKQTIEKGYDIVNAYSKSTYLDKNISLEKAYLFQPVPDSLTVEQQKKVLGLSCQMWCEWIPTEKAMNLKVYPRIAAYAECGWSSPDKKDYNRFLGSLGYFLKKWEKQGIVCGPVE